MREAITAAEPAAADAVKGAVHQAIEEYAAQFSTVDYADDWHSWTERLRHYQNNPGLSPDPRPDAVAELLGWLWRLRDYLREAMLGGMCPAARSAFYLGECLDRGVRRPDVHRHLYQPPAPPEDLGPIGWDPAAPRRVLPEVDNDTPLGNRSLGPGELPPEPHWEGELAGWWRVALGTDPPAVTPAGPAAADRVAAIDELDRAAVTGLAGGTPSEGRPEPTAPTPGPRSNRHDDQDKWIYNQLKKGTKTQSSVLSEFNRRYPQRKIRTVQGLIQAANRYRLRTDLPPLPPRRERSD
jgi:hypothetical protein